MSTKGVPLTSFSTFTGLGGMDLGLEAAGFETLACVEWDDDARRSLKANRSNWNLLSDGDIELIAQHLSPRDVGIQVSDLDLLVGAPPCQPYSKAAQWVAGARRGLDDRRGQYLNDFLALLVRFRPRVAVIENVRGFASGSTSALGHIARSLRDAGASEYEIDWRVLNAADYGVPQLRERAIVIITRVGTEFRWPTPVARTTTWDAIGVEAFTEPAPVSVGRWAELLPSIPEGHNYLWHTRRGGGEQLFGYRTRYWSFLLKLAKALPAWTLPAQPGPSTGPFHWDNRPLRIQEMLRLQSFPVDWIVEADRRVAAVRQVGNATPPLLAEALGLAIAAHIRGSNNIAAPTQFVIAPNRPIPPAALVGPVAPKFLHGVGAHSDHPGPGKGPGAAVYGSERVRPSPGI